MCWDSVKCGQGISSGPAGEWNSVVSLLEIAGCQISKLMLLFLTMQNVAIQQHCTPSLENRDDLIAITWWGHTHVHTHTHSVSFHVGRGERR